MSLHDRGPRPHPGKAKSLNNRLEWRELACKSRVILEQHALRGRATPRRESEPGDEWKHSLKELPASGHVTALSLPYWVTEQWSIIWFYCSNFISIKGHSGTAKVNISGTWVQDRAFFKVHRRLISSLCAHSHCDRLKIKLSSEHRRALEGWCLASAKCHSFIFPYCLDIFG